jgi:hypothetical protein
VDGDQPLQQAVARLDGGPAVGAVAGLVHAPLARVAPPVRGEFVLLPRARDRQRAKAAGRAISSSVSALIRAASWAFLGVGSHF